MQSIRVSLPVPTLVVMANDAGDFRVVLDLRKDAFADLGVRLHGSTFGKGQGPGLLEKARRQADFPDVVNESAHVRELLIIVAKPQPSNDIASIDRDCGRVTGRVPIPGVKCRHERSGEGKVRAFEAYVDLSKIIGQAPLLLIEPKQALSGECGCEEQREC